MTNITFDDSIAMIHPTEVPMQIYCEDIEKIVRRHRNTVRRWFITGRLPGHKLGEGRTALWYTDQEKLEKFIHRPLTAQELANLGIE